MKPSTKRLYSFRLRASAYGSEPRIEPVLVKFRLPLTNPQSVRRLADGKPLALVATTPTDGLLLIRDRAGLLVVWATQHWQRQLFNAQAAAYTHELVIRNLQGPFGSPIFAVMAERLSTSTGKIYLSYDEDRQELIRGLEGAAVAAAL